MNKYLFLTTLLLTGLSGCASSHYVEKEADSLTFFLQLPGAARVQFASSVDKYLFHDAVEKKPGIWQVTAPLSPELKYFYVVDGSVYLPECQFKETDDFGSKNCLYLP